MLDRSAVTTLTINHNALLAIVNFSTIDRAGVFISEPGES
jgi:hypothetical protein